MTFRPTGLAVEDGTLIRWRGRLRMPGLFDGEHELRLEPSPDGGTRFVQRETFTGLLVPMMPRVLDDTATGFAAMNTALRDRAVARTASADGPVPSGPGPPPGGSPARPRKAQQPGRAALYLKPVTGIEPPWPAWKPALAGSRAGGNVASTVA